MEIVEVDLTFLFWIRFLNYLEEIRSTDPKGKKNDRHTIPTAKPKKIMQDNEKASSSALIVSSEFQMRMINCWQNRRARILMMTEHSFVLNLK